MARKKTRKRKSKTTTRSRRAKTSTKKAITRLPDAVAGLARPPVSGNYYGPMTAPNADDNELDLRVDIDLSHPNSTVLNRVSGDIHMVFRLDSNEWRVYRESWIVDRPEVIWNESYVKITGEVRSWNRDSGDRTIVVEIPRTATEIGPATVTFSEGTNSDTYNCPWKSNLFRQIEMEIDVCDSVNVEPLLPSYQTDSHNNRPDDLPNRRLTIEETYAESGVGVEISSDHSVIDDSAPDFQFWTPAELHDLMVDHFESISAKPRWNMWGVMASRFINSGVGGIMFDAAAEFGGAGVPPERQGFAVFREHSWFKNLVSGTASNLAQAEASRKFLYTWIHEAGHAWNFLHSWDKSRPDSLSWMNYDWRYDDRHSEGDFWKRFEFRFDDDELLHMRHGNRAAVIMGGDSWGSGGHLESEPDGLAAIEIQGGAPPLELLVRSAKRFEFLEPVEVELRLRNLMDTPITVDGRFDPESGSVAIFIKGPDGHVQSYHPLMCLLADLQPVTLEPIKKYGKGPDRLSRSLPLSFGGHGFYFDKPGEYHVRAVYQGSGGILIPSNVHRITIGFPTSPDQERMAQDYFSSEVGLSLYLGGSQSPRLADGMRVLHRLATSYGFRQAGARAAAIVSDSVARPFFGVQQKKIKRIHKPDPVQALEVSREAVDVFAKSDDPAFNLPYQRLVEQRLQCWEQIDQPEKASAELESLHAGLANRGVNPSVLKQVSAIKFKPETKKKTSKRAKSSAKKSAKKRAKKKSTRKPKR